MTLMNARMSQISMPRRMAQGEQKDGESWHVDMRRKSSREWQQNTYKQYTPPHITHPPPPFDERAYA